METVYLHFEFYKKPSFWVFTKFLRINLEKFLNSFLFHGSLFEFDDTIEWTVCGFFTFSNIFTQSRKTPIEGHKEINF